MKKFKRVMQYVLISPVLVLVLLAYGFIWLGEAFDETAEWLIDWVHQ